MLFTLIPLEIPLLQMFFWKLKLRLWGTVSVWKKACLGSLETPQKVYKADYEFVLYMSKQCINSKNEDKNWYSMI